MGATSDLDYVRLRGPRSALSRGQTLFCAVCVFLCQYAQSSPMIAPFLAYSAPGEEIGTKAVGVVFAAYPLATALATPLPDRVIGMIGIGRTVMLGLLLTSFGSLAFGLIGAALPPSAMLLSTGLVITRSVSGVGAALAEAGCLTVVSTTGWGDDLGKALSVIEARPTSGKTP